MQKGSTVLITKDILMPDYLPTYGNKYWKTPNIDALALSGTVFTKHYTAAPSTGMSFSAMVMGLYSHQMKGRRRYVHVEHSSEPDFLFEQLESKDYECHIIWSENYNEYALPYSNCFSNAVIHTGLFNQFVGPHKNDDKKIVRNDNISKDTLDHIYNIIEEICSHEKKIFLWIHLPHVLRGRIAYGDDIDLFDEIIGYLRVKFGDKNIYISADHGNMNGSHNVFGYGFHVYQPAIRIPLITPRIAGLSFVDWPTSNTQLKDIMLQSKIDKMPYVLSDTKYCGQPKRRLAIIKDDYKLIYNKEGKSFELYDIEYDPNENVNLLLKSHFDKDRIRNNVAKQVYFYPYWDRAEQYYKDLMSIFKGIWIDETREEHYQNTFREVALGMKKFPDKIRCLKDLKKGNSNF